MSDHKQTYSELKIQELYRSFGKFQPKLNIIIICDASPRIGAKVTHW